MKTKVSHASSQLLRDVAPDLRLEWHPFRNASIDFDEFRANSSKAVWWLCRKNRKHEWQARVRNRAIDRNNCPYCSGRRVLPEESFAAMCSNLMAEWHATKNVSVDPWNIRPQSNKRVWWQCQTPFKHEWATAVHTRVRYKSGCKKCRLVATSLSVANPDIAKQWHPTKNKGLTPDRVSVGSRRLVWWQCSVNLRHAWRASVWSRTKAKSQCRICARESTPARMLSLDVSFPEIADQWHPTKNQPLRPSDVFPGSDKKVWWVCKNDPTHEWKASIRNRTKLNRGCRFCAVRSKYASPGRSLADRFPQIAVEWHSFKNAPLKAADVTPGSSRRVWWQCSKDPSHEWQATVVVRTQKKSRHICPFCSGFFVSGLNSLAAIYPIIAKEWHPTKNGPLTPHQVKKASGKRVWWKCSLNPSHEWLARVKNRTILGTGCPFCSLFRSAESNTNYFETFTNDIRALRAMSKRSPHGSSRLKQAFNRMIYSSVITALETYLSDAFYQTVIKDESLVERLMLTTPDFAEKKYSLSEVVEWSKRSKEKVSDYLFNIVWHNLAKVRCLYRDVLGVVFPENTGDVYGAVVVRHDIVHRSGRSKGGKIHHFHQSDIQRLFASVELFVNDLDRQLKKRSMNA